jgi:hypothetical protein
MSSEFQKLEDFFPWLAPASIGSKVLDRFRDDWPSLTSGSPCSKLVSLVHAEQAKGGTQREFWIPWTVPALACFHRHHSSIHGSELWYAVQTIEMLSALPASWMPEDLESLMVAIGLSRALEHQWADDASTIGHLFSGIGGRWLEYAERIGATASDPSSFGAVFDRINDMMRNVAERLVEPVLAHVDVMGEKHAIPTALALLTPDGGMPLLLEKAARWHDVQMRLPSLRLPGTEGLEWPSLADPFTAGNGATIEFLVDRGAILEEGEAMQHCVSSYEEMCRLGVTHVASIARIGVSGVRERLSTVEIRMHDGEPKLVQHSGEWNTFAPGAAVDAIDEWMAAYASGSIPLNQEALVVRARPGIVFEIPAGRSPSEWRGILRRRLASGTWDDLVAEIVRIHAKVAERREDGPRFLDQLAA